MTPHFGFFQASFPAALLRSVALAIALLMQASPARSESIDLACTADGGHSARILIDTDNRSVAWVGESGPSQQVVTMMSEQFIKFGDKRGYDQISSEMTIDRVAGTMFLEQTYQGRQHATLRFVCRRATRKF